MKVNFDARLTDCQSYADLHAKRYRLKHFIAMNRDKKDSEPVGVALLSHPNGYYQAVVFERHGEWLYAAPTNIVI